MTSSPLRRTSPLPRTSWLLALALFLVLPAGASAAPRLALAVVGDSDSHGYQDTLAFPAGTPDRGGPHRAGTLQWTEALERLRGSEIDLGPRERTGTSGRVSRLLEWIGFDARSPAKLDHRRNFAVSGDGCEGLWGGNRQVPRLLRLMDADPAPWRHGAVVLRIGVNTFGRASDLDRLARDPADRSVQGHIDACLSGVARAVTALRERHPGTRVVLVGIFDNLHWARYLDRWPEPRQQAAIAAGLDRFDAGLRRIAAVDPGRVAFFDDRAWFAGLWGGRGADGRPAYHPLVLGPRLAVAHSAGDAPWNAVLADGHAGTAWNAKWAQSLVGLLDTAFDLRLTPVTDDEVRRLVAPSGAWPAQAR
jgi:hypothetical protein